VPTALLLSMHDLGQWSANAAAVDTPGGALPYGLEHLRRDFDLTWSDAQRRGMLTTRPAQALGGAVRRGVPGLQGSMAALSAIPRLQAVDVALSVFENVGLGFARLQGLSGNRRPLPHVMLTCWLAEDCQHMSPFQLRSVQRSARSISRLAVFSANQVRILRKTLGVEPEHISVVPFGVDTKYYDPARVSGPVGGGGLVAVGGDSRRDYATLAEAVRIAKVPLTLACYPRNIAGIDLPPQIKVVSGVYLDDYRKLLLSADLVVTPTVAPAYPSGQSVVLEAMSMGRATLTTASPAMQDYITDGIDGVLVPPRDPAAMARLIGALLADDGWRKSLGAAASATVRERFSLLRMWDSISALMGSAEYAPAR
jgi:glycosyltransferase involved in cell wall biosynthesis